MADIDQWSIVSANNNSASPDGWPENMAPAGVNDSARENMRAIRKQWNDAQWFQYGDGDGAATVTWVASNQFKVEGVDVSTEYHVGRRVKVTAATPGTIYGTISAVAFVTDTTVTVTFDSGSLSNEALTVWLSILRADNTGIPANQLASDVFVAGAGSVSAPSVTFSGDTDTGTYSPAADQWAVAIAGVERFLLSATAAAFPQPITTTDTSGSAVAARLLELYRNSSTPAVADEIVEIALAGNDAALAKIIYANLKAKILTIGAGTEDGEWILGALNNGTLADVLSGGPNGIYTAGATGGAQGVDSLNIKQLFFDGVRHGFEKFGPSTLTGSAVAFTSLRAGINRITVSIKALSLSGTDGALIQLGDSGGYETTGYTGTVRENDVGGGIWSTAGITLHQTGGAADQLNIILDLIHVGSNEWLVRGSGTYQGDTSSGSISTNGHKTLTGELDRLQIVPSGANTFDNGTISLLVE